MDFWQDLFQNTIIISAATAWCIAQILKTVIHLFMTKQFVAERLVGDGGMPSCHSATVCALATAVCYEYGPGGFEFAMAAFFAIIVMHDAMGVRRETGIQARVLNEMIQLFEDMGSNMPPQDKLKEFVGHTPLQVIIGAVLGILVSLAVCFLMN